MGHMSPSPFLTSDYSQGPKLKLSVLGLLAIEAWGPHSVATCEPRGPQALATPQGVLTLKDVPLLGHWRHELPTLGQAG